MITTKQQLINEQTSPLFRIMNGYDFNAHKILRNNICAFHIGNGLILSVAHNLRINPIVEMISDHLYQFDIINYACHFPQNASHVLAEAPRGRKRST